MITFTLLRPEHLDGMTAVENLCFHDPWSRSAFAAELENRAAVYLVAVEEDTNRVVGYAGMWLMVDMANITNVAVHPDWRRLGMARQMLTLLMKIAEEQGLEGITLEVRASNHSAQALYAALGFTALGRRKGYYQDREDAVIMTKMYIKDGGE